MAVLIGGISPNRPFTPRLSAHTPVAFQLLTKHRYDYGAPIREDRTLSPKYSEIKLQAAFLHASPDFLVATRFGNGTVGSGTAFSDNPRIYTTALSAPSGAHFYIVRPNSVMCVYIPEMILQWAHSRRPQVYGSNSVHIASKHHGRSLDYSTIQS